MLTIAFIADLQIVLGLDPTALPSDILAAVVALKQQVNDTEAAFESLVREHKAALRKRPSPFDHECSGSR